MSYLTYLLYRSNRCHYSFTHCDLEQHTQHFKNKNLEWKSRGVSGKLSLPSLLDVGGGFTKEGKELSLKEEIPAQEHYNKRQLDVVGSC